MLVGSRSALRTLPVIYERGGGNMVALGGGLFWGGFEQGVRERHERRHLCRRGKLSGFQESCSPFVLIWGPDALVLHSDFGTRSGGAVRFAGLKPLRRTVGPDPPFEVIAPARPNAAGRSRTPQRRRYNKGKAGSATRAGCFGFVFLRGPIRTRAAAGPFSVAALNLWF